MQIDFYPSRHISVGKYKSIIIQGKANLLQSDGKLPSFKQCCIFHSPFKGLIITYLPPENTKNNSRSVGRDSSWSEVVVLMDEKSTEAVICKESLHMNGLVTAMRKAITRILFIEKITY